MKPKFKNISWKLLPLFLLAFLIPHTTHAMYSASDVLGQFEADATTTTFNLNNTNGLPIPNATGVEYPYGIEMDTINHRLFVSDSSNSRILVYNLDSHNHLTHHYADYVLGQPDFTSNQPNQGMGTSVSMAMSDSVSSISYDESSQELFVTDFGNSRVLIFDLSNGISNDMPASYVLGQPDFTSNQQNQGGGVASTTMSGPNGVCISSSTKELFVADVYNNRVLIFDLSHGISNGMPASYVLGQPDFISNQNNQGGSVASTTMYGTYNLAYDSAHSRLFVNDDWNYRLLIFDLSHGITNGMPASYVLGQSDFTSNQRNQGGSVASTTLSAPESLSYDYGHDRLFVGDNNSNRVLTFDLSGGITNGMSASHVFGAGTTSMDVANDGSVVSSTTINDPELGMFYDTTNDNLWMTDNSNNRILMFDMSGGVIDNMPASDVLGQSDGVYGVFTTNDANNDHPNRLGLNYAEALYLDTTGHHLFVVDNSNNRVLVYNLDSNNQLTHQYADYVLGQPDFTSGQYNQGGSVASTTMNNPDGIYVSSSTQELFVTDTSNNRVLIFDLSHGISNGMPASYVLGQPDFTSNQQNQGGSVASTTMSTPQSVFVDSNTQKLFVADYGNSRVLIFDLSNGISNGMPASYVLGQPDFISGAYNQGGSVASTTMNFPYAMSYESIHSRLFVDDDSNYRVLIFDLSNGISNGMPASYVLGQPDFTSTDWTDASSTAVGYPEELAYDSNHDRLFVGDDTSSRILTFDLSHGITNGMAASAVIGAPDFNTNGYDIDDPPTQDTINDPELGMFYDTAKNRLWMTDNSNNRVLAFDFIKLPSITTTGTVGTAYSSTVSAVGAQGTVSYAVTSGSLPSGITLNSSSGAISGTPTVAGVSTFTITATDDNGSQGSFVDSKDYSINISSASTPTPPTTHHSSGGGSSLSAAQLALILTPSASTTAYLYSLNIPGCPVGYTCTPAVAPPGVSTPPVVTPQTFPRSLQLGFTGPDVKTLQQYLNAHGYIVSTSGAGSPGHETNTFASKTKAALIMFQKANGISPAIGFFGPITRAFVAGH